jgi:hypothetical protein
MSSCETPATTWGSGVSEAELRAERVPRPDEVAFDAPSAFAASADFAVSIAEAKAASGLSSKQLERAFAADQAPLTLLVASTGSGKTQAFLNAAITYVQRVGRLGRRGRPQYRRHDHHQDLQRFLAKLVLLGRRADAGGQSRAALANRASRAHEQSWQEEPPGHRVPASRRSPRGPDARGVTSVLVTRGNPGITI